MFPLSFPRIFEIAGKGSVVESSLSKEIVEIFAFYNSLEK